MESSISGPAGPLVESKVPFPGHMRRVPRLLQFIRQGGVGYGQAVRLRGKYDAMLKTGMYLEWES